MISTAKAWTPRWKRSRGRRTLGPSSIYARHGHRDRRNELSDLDASRDNSLCLANEIERRQPIDRSRIVARRAVGRTLLVYAAKGRTSAIDGEGDDSPFALSLGDTQKQVSQFPFRHCERSEAIQGPQYDRLGCWRRMLWPLDCFVARAPRNDGWVAADPIDSVVIGRRLSQSDYRTGCGDQQDFPLGARRRASHDRQAGAFRLWFPVGRGYFTFLSR